MLQLIQCGLSSVALCASVCFVFGMASTHLRRIAHICASAASQPLPISCSLIKFSKICPNRIWIIRYQDNLRHSHRTRYPHWQRTAANSRPKINHISFRMAWRAFFFVLQVLVRSPPFAHFTDSSCNAWMDGSPLNNLHRKQNIYFRFLPLERKMRCETVCRLPYAFASGIRSGACDGRNKCTVATAIIWTHYKIDYTTNATM